MSTVGDVRRPEGDGHEATAALSGAEPAPPRRPGPDKLMVVAICTRNRPRMLERCLASLTGLAPPPGWHWQLMVVENDTEARAQAVVEAAGARAGMEIAYRRQPILGIPHVRNMAIDAALEMGADWLAFVDDDETVAEDWLAEMTGAIADHEADVIEGPVYFDGSQGSLEWIGEYKYLFEEGTRRDRASTANVALSVRLVAPPPAGLGLRFDERLRFTGGSDTEFFTRATAAGAMIVWSKRPRVVEHLPPGRLTFGWQFRRWYRISANESQRLCGVHGWRGAARELVRPSLKLVRGGMFALAVSPFRLLYSRERFRSKAMRGGQRLAWGLGALAGLTPLRPRPYARVDGE